SGAVAQPTTSEMSRIQAACQGIRRVPSGGIGECRTSKLNSRTSENNDIISTGANDVQKFGGGQYWPGSDDMRDHVIKSDANEKKETILF
ncbi:hypothetical protein ACEUA0_21020, partial [Aeromonas veronii]